MVSTSTINRAKKVEMLRESVNHILDMLELEHKQRATVNMSQFKKMLNQVKSMKDKATTTINQDNHV